MVLARQDMKRGEAMKRNTSFMVFIFSLICFLVFPLNMYAEEGGNLHTKPNQYLFTINNMKPGDSAERTLTIQNRGEVDFRYSTEQKFKKGSKKLFNEFLLKVTDGNGILYEGKLKDFKGLPERFLKAKTEEDIQFLVKFPDALGNEFQGLTFETAFLFYIEDLTTEPEQNETPGPNQSDNSNQPRPITDTTSPPKEGKILPSTATNYFNFMMIGICFIFIGGIAYFLYTKAKVNQSNS